MRKLHRVLGKLVAVSLLTMGAVPAHAALRMSVAAETTNKAKPGATVPPDSASRSEVVLADSYISSRTGNTTTVYDFARRRRYVLDEAAKSYEEYSLYDVVGFRELELRNREGLRKAMTAAQLQDKLPDELEDAHELSIPSPGAAPVTQHAEGEEEVFASGGVTLLRHGKEARPVGAADAARFVQFLRYQFAGHPAVLDGLQKAQRIPASLRYSFHPGWGDRSVLLKIDAVRETGAAPGFTLDGYTPRAAAADGGSLDALLDRAWASRATLAGKASLGSGDALAARMREQPPLDAYLTLMESQLSGARMPALSDEQKLAFQADPNLRKLAQALAARDRAGLRQAVGSLQLLRMQVQSRRYLLQLYEANDRMQLGEADAARDLYAEVLRGNSAIAGAYKDIGDFYFRSFDPPRAWRSWEIARTLAPMFPNLQPVTQFERTLADRFPTYF
ncbi:hypothetical protein [Massilia aerilata]|uniref:Uncharacterized protein n=1 Tax=Massilia aerilata TaxID=453817 RepID=A0ABW0S756_9BURK